jgi:hypothetical protein
MKTPVRNVAIEMTDAELDRLLTLASKPPSTGDAQKALLARIARGTSVNPTSNIVDFPGSTKKSSPVRWLAALPLAASLAAGIWLGAAGQGTDYLFNVSDELASVTDSFNTSTGIDDAESLTEEDLT